MCEFCKRILYGVRVRSTTVIQMFAACSCTCCSAVQALAEMEMLIKSLSPRVPTAQRSKVTGLAHCFSGGYTNHVLAVVAPLAECQQRGLLDIARLKLLQL